MSDVSLTTLPRYDSDLASEQSGHAVVVGASMAGLLAARVLADWFEAVTIVEKDSLPDEPIARRGVPQSHHPHALLEAGRATLADLFPGYVEDLVSAGAVVTDFASDVQFYADGAFLAHGPVRMETPSATRPLIEQVTREHLSKLDAVETRDDCQFTDYLLDDAGTTVEGVRIRENGTATELPAELVVDATGRASRTPKWLSNHGYTPPEVEEVHIDVAYSTTYIERPPDDRRTFLVPPSPPITRGGMVAPVEGDRWVVNMNGIHGDDPPTDFAGFSEFAGTLPTPEVKRLLDGHPFAAADIEHYPFPSNRRNRYEGLDRFPDGLLVVGDAIASFNPVYAQGISVAALEALVLHQTLAEDGSENFALRFFDRAGAVVDEAWLLAVGSDFRFPQTTGPKPRGTDLVGRYLSRLTHKAHTDGALSDAFVRVMTMERPPTSLFRPGIAWRVLKPVG